MNFVKNVNHVGTTIVETREKIPPLERTHILDMLSVRSAKRGTHPVGPTKFKKNCVSGRFLDFL